MSTIATEDLKMDRRFMLRSAGSTALGGGLLAAGPAHAADAQRARRPGGRRDGDFIQAEDGTRLACKDCADAKPVVFPHACALPSQRWDYQLVPLCDQGRRCGANDRRGHGRSSLSNGGHDVDTLASRNSS